MRWRGAPRGSRSRCVARLTQTADAAPKRDAAGTPAIYSQTVESDAIKSFLATLMRKSDLFDTSMHHDAHEFLNFTLNQIGEDLSALHAKQDGRAPSASADDTQHTYVHDLFQGVLTNETKCLTCENVRVPLTQVSYRDEEFLDLSINVSPFTSVSSCLRQFSESEMLHGRNKFFCDACSSLQEAEKRMKIRHSPNILALHLKRFKWDERAQGYVKHACRVVFPLDLRLFNMSDQADNPDRNYELFAIVIHVGAGAHQGHYVSIVKIGQRWALFDDESVSFIAESDISRYFGDSPEIGSAYVLFYRAQDLGASHPASHTPHSQHARRAAAPAAAPPATLASTPTGAPTSAPAAMPSAAARTDARLGTSAPAPSLASAALPASPPGLAPLASAPVSPASAPAPALPSTPTRHARAPFIAPPRAPEHGAAAPASPPSAPLPPSVAPHTSGAGTVASVSLADARAPYAPATPDAGGTRSVPMPVSQEGAPAPVTPAPVVVAAAHEASEPVPTPALFPDAPSPTLPTKIGGTVPMVQTTAADAPPIASAGPAVASAPAEASPAPAPARADASPSRPDAAPKKSWLNRALRLDRSEKS